MHLQHEGEEQLANTCCFVPATSMHNPKHVLCFGETDYCNIRSVNSAQSHEPSLPSLVLFGLCYARNCSNFDH